MTPQEAYAAGWDMAVTAVAGMLRAEAEACIGDIVSGDTEGARLANARAGALLTAESDVLAIKNVKLTV
jgi:hypothetical protein